MTVDLIFDSFVISPFDELVAYEYLYSLEKTTLRSITQQTVLSNKLPSEALADYAGLLEPEGLNLIRDFLRSKTDSFSIAVNNTPSYPKKLRESERPTPLIYYKGDIGFLESPSVSVVGTRKASEHGLARARKLARELAQEKITVVSGLARGIDTAALSEAIKAGGNVIGVIGTPIDTYYPKENKDLQDEIAGRFLLISQVPFYRYAYQSIQTKRYYFPERNELMAAVSDATVIIEASDTSGTLSQARACLSQGRPLFILRSCVEDPSVEWPQKYLEKAPQSVFILDDVNQIVESLRVSQQQDV